MRLNEEGETRIRSSFERLPRVEDGPGQRCTANLGQDVESRTWRVTRQSIA